MDNKLPSPLIATVSEIISQHYSHATLDRQFMYANAPGEAPDGSKLAKTQDWLIRCNKDFKTTPFQVLGKLIEDYMDEELPRPSNCPWDTQPDPIEQKQQNCREKIKSVLATYGYYYFPGGVIRKSGSIGPTRTLENVLQNMDLAAVDAEFKRTMDNIEKDPPAALTGACAILESICKIYIKEKNLPKPKDQSIKPLWNTVRKDLGLNPEHIQDQDLLKIITGTISIVDGIGALRTHAGSAHGREKIRYRLKPRHIRLAIHASHTLVTFIIETWAEKGLKH
jgi:hypothetical protein